MTSAVLDPLVHEAHEKFQEIQRRVDEFFDQVNSVLSWVPAFLSHLIEPIRTAIGVLVTKLREFCDRANQLMEQPGSPSRLGEAADQWVSQVSAPIAEIAGTIAPDRLRTNVEWAGRAAEAYRATVPAQMSGLDTAKDIANQMHTSLTNLANSVESFWLTIHVAFAAFVVGAVGALVAAVTVVGVPVAIATLTAAAGLSIGLIAAAITAVTNHMNTIEAEQAAIGQQIIELGTRWSMSDITTMSDASVADGDGSDWRVNR